MEACDLVLPHLQTYLSNSVQRIMKLAKSTGMEVSNFPSAIPHFNEFTINEDFLSEIYSSIEKDGIQRNYEFYFHAIEHFSSYKLFSASSDLFIGRESLNVENVSNNVKWMANPDIVEKYLLALSKDTSGVSTFAFLLLITADLERSLGNVYLLKGKQVPSCMRDLLSSRELMEIFGETMMTTLQAIVGPPTSLNIRNIVWHGFAAPQEIPECACFLIIVLATLGKTLAMRQIKEIDITIRPSLQLEQINRLSGILPNISSEDISELATVFNTSPYVAPQMISLYHASLNYFLEGKHLESTVLILPQMEHCLRTLFAAINNCAERVLTAEADTLFTTLDEILATHLDNGAPNLLLEFLGDEMMVALLDIFVEPDGPRIRDRLSHGEVQLQYISETISSHLICLTAALVSWKNQRAYFHNDHSLVSKIKTAVRNYKSIFHVSTSVANEILSACKHLSTCKNLVSSCGLDLNLHSKSMTGELKLFIGDEHEEDFTGALEPFGSLEFLEQLVGRLSLKTLYRPRKEMELLARLNRICRALSTTLKHMIDFLLFKKPLLDMHQLRSRQRETFQRVLDSVPAISTGCRLVILLAYRQLLRSNDTESRPEIEHRINKKFLKNVETFTDNLSMMTDVTKNRWHEGSKLSQDFMQQTCRHLRDSSLPC